MLMMACVASETDQESRRGVSQPVTPDLRINLQWKWERGLPYMTFKQNGEGRSRKTPNLWTNSVNFVDEDER